MRYQGDIIAELVDYGYLDNEVDLQDRTYCGTKNDWVETDFNHYDEPISTAFKTTLKSDLPFYSQNHYFILFNHPGQSFNDEVNRFFPG